MNETINGIMAILSFLMVMIIGPLFITISAVWLAWFSGKGMVNAVGSGMWMEAIVLGTFTIFSICLWMVWFASSYSDYKTLWSSAIEIYREEEYK